MRVAEFIMRPFFIRPMMTAPMVLEGFVVRLPDCQRMLIDDEWSQRNARRESDSGGSFRQLDFHAPKIAHGRIAVISQEVVSGIVLVVHQALDKHSCRRRGKLHFSLRAPGYFFKQSRTNPWEP